MSNTTKRSRYTKDGNLSDAVGTSRLFPEDAEDIAFRERMSGYRARLNARQKMHHKMGISKYFFHALGNRKYIKVRQRGG